MHVLSLRRSRRLNLIVSCDQDTLEATCAELRSGKQALSDACLATKSELEEMTANHQSELSNEQEIQVALKGHLKVGVRVYDNT